MSRSTILYILITTLNRGNTQIWSKFKRKKKFSQRFNSTCLHLFQTRFIRNKISGIIKTKSTDFFFFL